MAPSLREGREAPAWPGERVPASRLAAGEDPHRAVDKDGLLCEMCWSKVWLETSVGKLLEGVAVRELSQTTKMGQQT